MDTTRALASAAAVAVITVAYTRWLDVTNATTVALTCVLVVAATSRLWVAVMTSIEVEPSNPRYLISEPWVGYRLATALPSGA